MIPQYSQYGTRVEQVACVRMANPGDLAKAIPPFVRVLKVVTIRLPNNGREYRTNQSNIASKRPILPLPITGLQTANLQALHRKQRRRLLTHDRIHWICFRSTSLRTWVLWWLPHRQPSRTASGVSLHVTREAEPRSGSSVWSHN